MVTVKSISLNDFQSYAEGEGEFEFAPGLNAIRSVHNSAGKSTIFKAFKVASNPDLLRTKADRMSYIRRHCEAAEVDFVFSDGYEGAVVIYPEDAYYIYGVDGKYTKTRKPSKEFIEKLGIIIDTDTGFIANIRDEEQGKLLIDTNSNTNSNLLKIITEHRELNRMAVDVESKLKDLDSKYIRLSEEKSKVYQRLDTLEYVDISIYEQKRDALATGIPLLTTYRDMYDVVGRFKYMNGEIKDYDTLELCASVGSMLSNMLDITKDINPRKYDDKYFEHLISSIDLATDIKDSLNLVNGINKTIDDRIFDIAINLNDSISLVSEVNNNKTVDVEDFNTIDSLCNIGSSLKSSLNILNNLNVVKSDDELEHINNISSLGESLSLALLTTKRIYNMVSIINKQNLKIAELESELNIEGKSFSCPIHGNIVYKDGNCIPTS